MQKHNLFNCFHNVLKSNFKMSDVEYSSDSSGLQDSSSSSSDEEFLEMYGNGKRRTKNENYFEHTIPLYSDAVFFEHFSVSRHVAEDIADRFANSEQYNYQSEGNGKLNALQHTLIFLWFAGHATASFRDVADRFDITISSLFYVIRRMTYFLSNLAENVIKWPTAEEKIEIEQYFHNNNFPGVIGAIDGSHIKIDKPQNDPDSYLNRKHFFSIQVIFVIYFE